MSKGDLLSGWAPTPEDDRGFIEVIDLFIDTAIERKVDVHTKLKRRGYDIHIICGKGFVVGGAFEDISTQ